MEDNEIISLLESRDEKAIEQIRIKYSSYLFTIANNILGDDREAEECVSETCFRAWSSIPPEHPDSLSRYLSSIIRNCALDIIRTRKTAKRLNSEYSLSIDEIGDLISSDGIPEDEIDADFLRNSISSFLRSVPEKQRTVFIRRYFFFDSLKEIAVFNGMSVSSVKVTLFRLRKELKEHLMKEGYYL
ncbi:MAG: sigma-70 family RNA polymerase sigma factor [Clostridia bacterium]|nr:sigma-70 family RNA polymerase sigma factor [Clostridia bacterium]